MALNSSGPISLGGATAGQSINLEVGQPATSTVTLNDTIVRTLASKVTSNTEIIVPTDFYGKAIANAYAMFVSVTPNFTNTTMLLNSHLKLNDKFILNYQGQGQAPSLGPNNPGTSATVSVSESGTVNWTHAYNFYAPGTHPYTSSQNPLVSDLPGSTLYQFEGWRPQTPPTQPTAYDRRSVQTVKNASTGAIISQGSAYATYSTLILDYKFFSNGNKYINWSQTFASNTAYAYIENPSGTVLNNLRYSAPGTGTSGGGTRAAERFSYADPAAKTDIVGLYSTWGIPTAQGQNAPPANTLRWFQHYAKFNESGSLTFSKWVSYNNNGYRHVKNVALGSPPALPYHVGVSATSMLNSSGPNVNNILMFKFDRNTGNLVGNGNFWNNQFTTPSQTSSQPFSPDNVVVSSLNASGLFSTLSRAVSTPTALSPHYEWRWWQSNPTFSNTASYSVAATAGGSPLYAENTFVIAPHNGGGFGADILEEDDYIYPVFGFVSVDPLVYCILKIKKDASTLASGLTVTSPAFSKTITIAPISNRSIYDTPGIQTGDSTNNLGVTTHPPFSTPQSNTARPAMTVSTAKITI